ncbi:MAG: hypothetical protein ACRD1S_05875 [Vicinamibacterales bacterium]
MRRLFAGGTGVAVALALGMVVFAETAAQTPPQPQPPTSSQPTAQPAAQPEQQITLVGCVQSEADYRRAKNLGGGGAAGTGVGVGNEFVLVNASASTASSSTPTTGTAGTAGTAGAPTATGDAYELTGKNEGQVSQFVGRRVEIVGKLKAAEVGAAGPTGGATAGAPPSGVDVASKDLKLRELEVTSVRESTGSCPTMQR